MGVCRPLLLVTQELVPLALPGVDDGGVRARILAAPGELVRVPVGSVRGDTPWD